MEKGRIRVQDFLARMPLFNERTNAECVLRRVAAARLRPRPLLDPS